MKRSIQYDDILEEIKKCHNEQLAKESGHVYQIWNDGEITLQKSGNLLNMRNLHTMESGFTLDKDTIYSSYWNIKKEDMPNRKDGSAYVTKDDAYRIRQMMAKYLIQELAIVTNLEVGIVHRTEEKVEG
jgi:hypothetical protein